MDWFERLTGFRETGYEDTRRKLQVDGSVLRSRVNGQGHGIGELELLPLATLRERVGPRPGLTRKLKLSVVSGDVRRLHRMPQYADALFQVASQFNLLEMVSPDVTPEEGVTRYQHDGTQGPACAIAAGAATIYRNYFAPVGDQLGQTGLRQMNGLGDLGEALRAALGRPVGHLWTMRNGYALCTREGLDAIAEYLASSPVEVLDALRGKLRIGVHRDVEVTDAEGIDRPHVSQAFCSALPVAYTRIPGANWRPFATLVLEAAYEATLWAAVDNTRRGKSRVVLLTQLGGGVFGNNEEWIHSAMRRAVRKAAGFDLDVRIVSHGPPSPAILQLADEFA